MGTEVLDLNLVGTTLDGVLRYRGEPSVGDPLGFEACSRVFAPRIFRYTAAVAGRVAFSVDNPGTTIDTSMVVLDDCPGVGVTLGCVADRGATAMGVAVVSPGRRLAAGESVYVVVGPFSMNGLEGAFELTAYPVTEVANGAVCFGAQVCMTGASCLPSAPMPGAERRCFINGGLGGACRFPAAVDPPLCDAGLACLPSSGRCGPELHAGAECDPLGLVNVCDALTTCRGLPGAGGPATTYRCAVFGALGGGCRGGAPFCDSGLGCSSTRQCVPEVAVGMSCSADAVSCVAGASCQPVGADSVCVADGVLNGRCRVTATPCDAGLGCAMLPGRTNVCLAAIAIGAACEAVGPSSACANGSSCHGAPGLARCVADGARSGRCRRTAIACDAGLGCSAGDLCLPEVAAGGACDVEGLLAVCATGTGCARLRGASVCVANGTELGACRGVAPRCDTGLACAGERCVPVVALGASCDATRTGDACPDGASCVASAPMSVVSICRLDGIRGGACREAGVRCDAGLACDRGVGEGGSCLSAIAVGGACGERPSVEICADGSACLGDVGRCVADGVEGGRCRASMSPCNVGLGCGRHLLCVTAVGLGAVCDTAGMFTACVAPQRCVPPGAPEAGTCRTPSYVESEIPSPTFIDACTADAIRPTFAARSNALSGSVPLGFSFRSYDASYTSMRVSTNGVLMLGDAAVSSLPVAGGSAFPLDDSPRPLFAAFWDDIVLRAEGSVCVRTVGAAPTRVTIVEWFDVAAFVDTMTHLTFEIVLREGSNQVDLIYQTLDRGGGPLRRVDGTTAAVGVQGPMALDATRHIGPVSTTRGITFTPR